MNLLPGPGTRIGGKPAYKRRAFPILSLNLLRASKPTEHFTPLKLPINEVLNTIKVGQAPETNPVRSYVSWRKRVLFPS